MNNVLPFFSLFLIIPIIAILFLFAPLLIGILVYKDAQKRGLQSAGIWALVAALVPAYIGLLLYVIIGTTQSNNGSKS